MDLLNPLRKVKLVRVHPSTTFGICDFKPLLSNQATHVITCVEQISKKFKWYKRLHGLLSSSPVHDRSGLTNSASPVNLDILRKGPKNGHEGQASAEDNDSAVSFHVIHLIQASSRTFRIWMLAQSLRIVVRLRHGMKMPWMQALHQEMQAPKSTFLPLLPHQPTPSQM